MANLWDNAFPPVKRNSFPFTDASLLLPFESKSVDDGDSFFNGDELPVSGLECTGVRALGDTGAWA